MKKLILILTFLLITGCIAKFKDVSDEPQYKSLLNNTYILTEAMYISGVNSPPGYGKDINVYTIGPTNPTWSGPELITRNTLQEGTLLTIQSIKECTNCFSERVVAYVTVEPFKKVVNVPIYINLNHIKTGKHLREK